PVTSATFPSSRNAFNICLGSIRPPGSRYRTGKSLPHGKPLDLFDLATPLSLEIQTMRILVTGVTGRIGVTLAAALCSEGHAVRGLVWPRDPQVEKLRGLNIQLLEGSLTD